MYAVTLLRVGLFGALVWFQYVLLLQLFHFMQTMRYGFLPCYLSLATVAVLLYTEYDKLLLVAANPCGSGSKNKSADADVSLLAAGGERKRRESS